MSETSDSTGPLQRLEHAVQEFVGAGHDRPGDELPDDELRRDTSDAGQGDPLIAPETTDVGNLARQNDSDQAEWASVEEQGR